MRQALWYGAVIFGLAAQSSTAQQAMSAQTSIGANQSIMAAILNPVSDAVYQADKVSRSVQTLSDGTVITRETRGLIARDAQGRIREDLYIVQSGQINGKQQNMSLQSATVGDPVAHTMLIWTGTLSKIAMQMRLPSLPTKALAGVLKVPPSPPPPGGFIGDGQKHITALREEAAPETRIRDAAASMPRSAPRLLDGLGGPKDDVRTEQLGQQSMEGVLVTGKRVTTTIATGKVGNDRPIVVVHEEWRSPELKIVVKTVDTDPRTGVQTMELQGLSRTDPDPALFQAPAGYVVKDMAEMVKGLGELGKAKSQ